jgi:hypothetical protein
MQRPCQAEKINEINNLPFIDSERSKYLYVNRYGVRTEPLHFQEKVDVR